MAFITDILNTIKNARKGKDMRQAIYDGIQQCYKDATGHPDSVAAVVERLKIEKGRIAQQGTHEQLMKQEGIYKRFVDARQQAVSWKLVY